MDEFAPIEEIMDVKTFTDDLTKVFSRLPPEERAYKLINNFFKLENPSEEICDQFYGWLSDRYNQSAKKMAMERVLSKYFEKQII